MTLDSLREYLLINSLQYFIGIDDIEVDDVVLSGLVKRAISTYANWRPLFKQSDFSVSEYTTIMKYDTEGRRILSIVDLYFFDPILAGPSGRIQWSWDYNKDNGLFRTEITGSYIAELLVEGTLEDYDSTNVELIEMILGIYMMYVGSSRKSFSFGDQPFENDGSELYSEGKELWENTLASLKTEQDNWYLSIL